jgi:hypothetical protein
LSGLHAAEARPVGGDLAVVNLLLDACFTIAPPDSSADLLGFLSRHALLYAQHTRYSLSAAFSTLKVRLLIHFGDRIVAIASAVFLVWTLSSAGVEDE